MTSLIVQAKSPVSMKPNPSESRLRVDWVSLKFAGRFPKAKMPARVPDAPIKPAQSPNPGLHCCCCGPEPGWRLPPVASLKSVFDGNTGYKHKASMAQYCAQRKTQSASMTLRGWIASITVASGTHGPAPGLSHFSPMCYSLSFGSTMP